MFAAIKDTWGSLDFVVHAIGFSDKNELKGRYADTTRANFSRTMVISCFSFTEVTKRAAELMPNGGSIITLTFGGSMRVMPNYNVMGVAKAALEASTRYLAADAEAGRSQRRCGTRGRGVADSKNESTLRWSRKSRVSSVCRILSTAARRSMRCDNHSA